MAPHKYQRRRNAPFGYVFVLNILLVWIVKRIATERTLLVVLIGNTHVGIYIPAETGCLWFIEVYFDCTIIPGSSPEMLLPPMSKNVSVIEVKVGEVGGGTFPSWKCWYRFF